MDTKMKKTKSTERTYQCTACPDSRVQKLSKSGRMIRPRRWKSKGDDWYCEPCWSARYVLRAITIPIAGPFIDPLDSRDFAVASRETWKQLRDSLRTAFSAVTRLYNWHTRQLYLADTLRNGQAKMPPLKSPYLYHEAKEVCPEIPTACITAIQHATEARYRRTRYEVIWTGERSIANYRYPQPWLVQDGAWKIKEVKTTGTDGQDSSLIILDVSIAKDPYLLVLRGGAGFRRQTNQIRQVIAGDAISVSLEIISKRANDGDHRNGARDRSPGGGSFVARRIMAKIVAWLPRRPARTDLAGTLNIRTGSHALLVASVDGDDRPWVLKANEVRQWIRCHEEQLDGMKRGLVRSVGATDRRKKSCDRHHARLTEFVKRAASWICKMAERRRVEKVVFDDSDRRYFGSFQWDALRRQISMKCDEIGISFALAASGEVATKTQEVLECP